MIRWTERHTAVLEAYEAIIGFGSDEEREKNRNRGALHRLKALVPETAPDQEKLARTLAELMLDRLWPRMQQSEYPLVGEMLGEAHSLENDGKEGYRRLAELVFGEEKWKRRIAWAACQELTKPEHRVGFEQKGKQRQQVTKPVPAPIQQLMERYFRGEIEAPNRPRGRRDPAKGPFFDGGIVLMIHAASESALKPSRNEASKNRCSIDIVTEALHDYGVDDRKADTIKRVWEKRSRGLSDPLTLIPT